MDWQRATIRLDGGRCVDGFVDPRGWFAVHPNVGRKAGKPRGMKPSRYVVRPHVQGRADYRKRYILTHLRSGMGFADAVDPEVLICLADRLVDPEWIEYLPSGAVVRELEGLLPELAAAQDLEIALPGGTWMSSGGPGG